MTRFAKSTANFRLKSHGMSSCLWKRKKKNYQWANSEKDGFAHVRPKYWPLQRSLLFIKMGRYWYALIGIIPLQKYAYELTCAYCDRLIFFHINTLWNQMRSSLLSVYYVREKVGGRAAKGALHVTIEVCSTWALARCFLVLRVFFSFSEIIIFENLIFNSFFLTLVSK